MITAAIDRRTTAFETPKTVTRTEFVRFVDEAFETAKRDRENSAMAKFRNLWNSSTKTRFAVWMGLLATSAAAAASWAAVVAGSALAVRAAMSAVWGYFATDAAFDLVASKIGKNPLAKLLRAMESARDRKELDPLIDEIFLRYEESVLADELASARRRASIFKGVKKVTAVTVGSVLAVLWGSSAAEAATASPAVDSAVSETKSRVSALLSSKIPNINEVFSDIRADHPSQGYVTVEQAARRIEGLSRWISLDQSYKLSELNASVSAAVHDPSGKIATAMKELGYLSSEQSVDDAARKLSEEKIKAVLEKAYAIQDAEVPPSDATPSETVVPVPEVPVPMSEPTAPRSSVPVVRESVVPPAANPHPIPVEPSAKDVPVSVVPTPVQLPPEASKTNFSILGWLSLGAVAGAGWLFHRRSKLSKDSARTGASVSPVVETPPETDTAPAVPTIDPAVVRRRPRAPAVIPETPRTEPVVPDTVPKTNETPIRPPVPSVTEISDSESFEASRKAAFKSMHDHMVRSLGFTVDPSLSRAGERFMGKLGFSETVPTGSKFSLVVTTKESSVELSVACEDGGRSVFSKTSSLTLPSTHGAEGDFERSLESAADALLKSALEARHSFKYEEFRNVSRFEVSRSDFADIYRQLSVPEIARSNRETGWHWFASPYSVRNGVFRFEGLALPRLEEIDSSSVEFWIRQSASGTYIAPNVTKAWNRSFSKFEALFAREHGTPATLFMFNWHKHPGAPLWPSGGDLNAPNASPLVFNLSPGMWAQTYAIANKLSSVTNLASLKPGTFVILRGADFGRKDDYVMTFWKVLRITESEKARRTNAAEAGYASKLGVRNGSSAFPHLEREVEIPGHGKFWPDLVPVMVSEK